MQGNFRAENSNMDVPFAYLEYTSAMEYVT